MLLLYCSFYLNYQYFLIKELSLDLVTIIKDVLNYKFKKHKELIK